MGSHRFSYHMATTWGYTPQITRQLRPSLCAVQIALLPRSSQRETPIWWQRRWRDLLRNSAEKHCAVFPPSFSHFSANIPPLKHVSPCKFMETHRNHIKFHGRFVWNRFKAITHRIHVWYIWYHLPSIYPIHVSTYTIPWIRHGLQSMRTYKNDLAESTFEKEPPPPVAIQGVRSKLRLQGWASDPW